MSDHPSTPPATGEQPRPSRLRRFFLRHLPLGIAGATVALVLALIGFYFWASSAQCERLVRKWLVAKLETMTGGRVQIASFEWHLLDLDADARGVTIHGREAAGEAPLAHIEDLRVGLTVFGFLSPRVELRSLEAVQPSLHLIVYPDGSTNVPQPRRPRKPGHPLETLFHLEAGHIAVEQGWLDYDNRAASFDFQNRRAPLDLSANHVSLLMRYVPAARHAPASYRIEAGATDLNLRRAAARGRSETAHGSVQATLDLTRTAAYLRSLRLTTWRENGPRQVLQISGSLDSFAHPRWQAKAEGGFDMRLLQPVTGYPFAPDGIAHLDLTGAGAAGEFRADGAVHIDDGSYIGTGVRATGVRLDAHVHADPHQLSITSVVAHLRQGGVIEGAVTLGRWLPPIRGEAALEPSGEQFLEAPAGRGHARIVHPRPVTIPVDGKVMAKFDDVSLDTILGMVSQPPFQRLGVDTLVNGPATATWSNGDARTVVVSATLGLNTPAVPAAGEGPASGAVVATYTQRGGQVDLRNLSLHLPGSQLAAHGSLGVYPLTGPTNIAVDLHSRRLADFDTVLRSLGLRRGSKSGVAALPVSLAGHADFHGTWTGSLAEPRIAGNLKATELVLGVPASAPSAQPHNVRLDSADVTGSYSAARIAIQRAVLVRGASRVAVSGALDAEPGIKPAFDAGSVLHARVQAAHLGVDEVQPYLSAKLPVTGALDAQLQIEGPLRAPGGAGWVQLDGGSLYGEPVTRLRAQGSVANRVLKLASVTLTEPAGSASCSGSYDLASRRFQLSAAGAGIDIARIAWLERHGAEASGKLRFALSGSGTPADPRLDGSATLSGLSFSGEPVGTLQIAAHTANRALVYNAATRLVGAQLSLHGQTALSGDYATQAGVEFSQFNIAALLKLAHVEGLTGASSLAGVITLDGPLAHPAALHGEASLRELAVTLSGVHLKSEGGLHAILAHSRIVLDPLHITGEDTDLRAQGTMELTGAQRMDFAAQGSVNLKLAETLDPDLTASGTTSFEVQARGTVRNPELEGRVDFENGSLSLEDIPNGLSQLHGTLVFNQNQLEVKTLTAMSGGGLLSVGGFLAYQHGIFADLSVTGKGIRIRYPQGVSSLADVTLHLQGEESNLLLGGNVLITRFTVSPELDIAALAEQANAAVARVAPPEAPSNHIRLDVRVVSSPQLNFQNAYAKLAGDVSLRVRGTVASPSLLGRVSITEGAATIAGTRYELERGDITFTNPVRIEPNIDLSATARVDDYDITLDVHGTPSRLTVNYHSDPPLAEADVVSLLALGHTQNQERLYTEQQQQSLTNPTTDALLGGALNATVSSRVQRLFGAGSVKIDPNYLGALGNSTSRVTVQEQFGRNVTFTFATDADTTGQQLLQAEIAINRNLSLLVARDESGVFSMVIKATRRYR